MKTTGLHSDDGLTPLDILPAKEEWLSRAFIFGLMVLLIPLACIFILWLFFFVITVPTWTELMAIATNPVFQFIFFFELGGCILCNLHKRHLREIRVRDTGVNYIWQTSAVFFGVSTLLLARLLLVNRELLTLGVLLIPVVFYWGAMSFFVLAGWRLSLQPVKNEAREAPLARFK